MAVDLAAVRAAHELIRPHVLRTPLVDLLGGVRLKAESLQPVGSFKVRGAFHTALRLEPEAAARGLVAHSSGNHALAVAHVGRVLGLRTVVVMPSDAPLVKLQRTHALGAEVVTVGPSSAERAERAADLAAAEGLALVEPYDSEAVIAATGTISIEVVEDLRGAGAADAAIYVPISGGGLAAGVAMAAKELAPGVRVVGVEPEVAADALASRQARERRPLPAEQMALTSADGLRVQQVGATCWPYVERYVDDIVTVTEDEIATSMARIAAEAGLVAEPSGAVAAAAAVTGAGAPDVAPARRVALLTGRNVDLDRFLAMVGTARP